MRVWIRYYPSHANLRCSLEKSVCHQSICVRDGGQRPGDRQDAVMHARHDFADPRAHARFVSEVGHVLPRFANDHTCLLGGDNGAQGQLCGSVLFFRPRPVVGVEGAELIGHVVNARVDAWRHLFLARHDGREWR